MELPNNSSMLLLRFHVYSYGLNVTNITYLMKYAPENTQDFILNVHSKSIYDPTKR